MLSILAIKFNVGHYATAVHGGSWRCAYSVDSIGRASFIMGTLFG